MQINIVIEVDQPDADTDEICDGLREAVLVAVANMRAIGLPRVDEERYVTQHVVSQMVGQVSYFRPV